MGTAPTVLYEVECRLDPEIAAEYDAWLPDHVQRVLACGGFLGAAIEAPASRPGDPVFRRVRYRVESSAALEAYFASHAPRLRAELGEHFGDRVRCERRILAPSAELAAPGRERRRCLDCGAPLHGKHCQECGQAADAHVLSMREVMGDVTHSLLHLDSRVWRTLRLLVRRPGELTLEFIAGRHQRFLPPFRLYLAISILYFALSALLPGSGPLGADAGGGVVAPLSVDARDDLKKELEAEGVARAEIDRVMKPSEPCRIEFTDNPRFDDLEKSLSRACDQMRADGGKRFAERFAATAPKLMFVFLPLMAAIALPFYRRPRRLYAEHLVLFLHNHAFTFLLLGATDLLGAIGNAVPPISAVVGLVGTLLYLYLAWYVFRSMRVVYAERRLRTTLKFATLAAVYFILLGLTMLAGLVYAMLELS